MKQGQIVKVIKRCYYASHRKDQRHCTERNIINMLGQVVRLEESYSLGICIDFNERLDDIYVNSGKTFTAHSLWIKSECVIPATEREAFLFHLYSARALKEQDN